MVGNVFLAYQAIYTTFCFWYMSEIPATNEGLDQEIFKSFSNEFWIAILNCSKLYWLERTLVLESDLSISKLQNLDFMWPNI